MQNTPAMDSRKLFPGLSYSIARVPFFRRCRVDLVKRGKKRKEKGGGEKKEKKTGGGEGRKFARARVGCLNNSTAMPRLGSPPMQQRSNGGVHFLTCHRRAFVREYRARARFDSRRDAKRSARHSLKPNFFAWTPLQRPIICGRHFLTGVTFFIFNGGLIVSPLSFCHAFRV